MLQLRKGGYMLCDRLAGLGGGVYISGLCTQYKILNFIRYLPTGM